ncbi:hypothetical protein LPJ73_000008 [Coemansia sp. RSA 2703]|nr:hypothetical protein LPJ73_000008 [Coemansia sp. RSA 2703]KAJ2379386.1 hypothetical protein IW150_000206 [Coemansia sp. RSA 2607]KAJ2398392.1 hypothetical protein GGI05_000109 [Coemansia sp. RSA 2603]
MAPDRENDVHETVEGATDTSAVDILLHALRKTPPETPGQVLDRIAEAHAIGSIQYITAIVQAISDRTECGLAFKPHILTLEVCERLLEAISRTDANNLNMRIDSDVLVQLYRISRDRHWNIDSKVLESTAIYLANSSFFAVLRAIDLVNCVQDGSKGNGNSIWRFRISDLEAQEVSISDIRERSKTVLSPQQQAELSSILLEDPLDTAVDIAKVIVDRSFAVDRPFYMFMLRALCMRDRAVDADWLFDLAKQDFNRHTGTEYASMMSMYYRQGEDAIANALFDEFVGLWSKKWKDISNATVMPDAVSFQAEKWRQQHTLHIQSPNLIDVGELERLCRRASGPFYRNALELIRQGQIDQAMQALNKSKYEHHVTLVSRQLRVLVHALIARGCIDQACSLYTVFQHGLNTRGGNNVCAADVVFGENPSGYVTGVLLRELGSINDWDRIWSIVDSDADLTFADEYIEVVKFLVERALDTRNRTQAIRCAQLAARIAKRHSLALEALSAEWINDVFSRATDLYSDSSDNQLVSLFSALLAELLQKSPEAQSQIYSQWNARTIQRSLNVARQALDPETREKLHSAIYATVDQAGVLESYSISKVLIDESIQLFATLPANLTSVPTTPDAVLGSDGWSGNTAEIRFGRGNSKFWECTVRAFVHEKSVSSKLSSETACHLLKTLKLGFICGARIDNKLLDLANDCLIGAGYPAVDSRTGNLLPREKQEQKRAKYQESQHWEAASLAAEEKRQRGIIAVRLYHDNRATKLAMTDHSSSTAIAFNTPLPDKIKWYAARRKAGDIPVLAHLLHLVRDAMHQSSRTVWEPIVRDHMPEYLDRLGKQNSNSNAKSLSKRTKYAATIWSHAVFAYANLGEVEEAMVYYRRIVSEGGYPIAQSTAVLLALLSSSAVPLPTFPRGWDGPATRIYGLNPMYPPQVDLPSDTILVPKTAAERKTMVAQIGLTMLYAMFKHKIWPTAHFYGVLLSTVGHAGMISELRQIFEVVMPASMRAMPPELRINPAFMPSPIIWNMAIREAAKAGERTLAEYWFKEYRMSTMPLFREEASAYSRFTYRDKPKYARLFLLGRPYYMIPNLRRPLLEDGSEPSPWYDLGEVEVQLEMDRLRALDKLPMAHLDAVKMLTIYTTVDEHRNMESSELLADEINVLYLDKMVPRYSRARGAADLAVCWKLMVKGYLGAIAYLQQQVEHDIVAINRYKKRLAFWYRKWTDDVAKSRAHGDISGHHRMVLSKQDISLIESICSK